MLSCLLLPATTLSAGLDPYRNADNYNFSLPDQKGQLHTLVDYRNKVVLVNFWASWCTPCLLEMPGMQRLSNIMNDENFEILTINTSDTPRRIQETLKRLQVNLIVLQDQDSTTFKAWNGNVLPTSYLLDYNGLVRYRVVGPMEWDNADVIVKIKKLIKSQ